MPRVPSRAMRIQDDSQGLDNQRVLCGIAFWHFTVSVTPDAMAAHAPSVAVRSAAASDEAEAVLQLDSPLYAIQTCTRYFPRPTVEYTMNARKASTRIPIMSPNLFRVSP